MAVAALSKGLKWALLISQMITSRSQVDMCVRRHRRPLMHDEAVIQIRTVSRGDCVFPGVSVALEASLGRLWPVIRVKCYGNVNLDVLVFTE